MAKKSFVCRASGWYDVVRLCYQESFVGDQVGSLWVNRMASFMLPVEENVVTGLFKCFTRSQDVADLQ